MMEVMYPAVPMVPGGRRYGLAALVAVGCGAPPATSSATSAPVPSAQASAEVRGVATLPTAEPACADPAVIFEAGVERGVVCPADALARHLTILDLDDAWTPSLFAPQPDGTAPSYRAQYLMLAAEHDANGKPITGEGALGELYGVLPSLAIVRERLADDPRHFCHAFIDSDAIARLGRPYAQDDKDLVRGADQVRVALAVELERERARRALPDLAALATVTRSRGGSISPTSTPASSRPRSTTCVKTSWPRPTPTAA